jgi:putative tRNA adenosine deaminase-associated protein
MIGTTQHTTGPCCASSGKECQVSGYADDEAVDFALVVYREENVWRVGEVADEVLGDVETLAAELRRYPGDFGSLGLVSIDEDFFVLLRVAGSHVRLLLSDVTAATEWPLARSVLETLDLDLPDEEDDPEPAGDLGIVADLGLAAMDMGALLDDDELYPDEALSEIAHMLGFGALYDDAVGVSA